MTNYTNFNGSHIFRSLLHCLKSTNVSIFVMPAAISRMLKQEISCIVENFSLTHLASNPNCPNWRIARYPFCPLSNWAKNRESEKKFIRVFLFFILFCFLLLWLWFYIEKRINEWYTGSRDCRSCSQLPTPLILSQLFRDRTAAPCLHACFAPALNSAVFPGSTVHCSSSSSSGVRP